MLDGVTPPYNVQGNEGGTTGVAMQINRKQQQDIKWLCNELKVDHDMAWQFYEETDKNRTEASNNIRVTQNRFRAYEADKVLCMLCDQRITEGGEHKGPYRQGCTSCKMERNENIKFCLHCGCKSKFGKAPDLKPQSRKCFFCKRLVPSEKWFEGISTDDISYLHQCPGVDYKGRWISQFNGVDLM